MSLDNAVENLSATLGHPIVIIDVDWNVAAASFHDSEAGREQLSLTLTVSNQELAESLLKAESARVRRRAVRVPTDRSESSRVIAPLNHDNRLLGYLTYLDDEPVEAPIPGSVEKAIADASDELGLRLALWGFEVRNRAEHTRKLIRDLVGETRTTRETAGSRLLDEGLISDSGECCVLVFRSTYPRDRLSVRRATEKTLNLVARSTTVRIAGAALGDEGVFVFPRQVSRSRLATVLGEKGLEAVCAGIGGLRTSLMDAGESYHEAQIAWRASARDPRRYGRSAFWDDLGIDRLLLQLPLDELSPHDFPPEVQSVMTLPTGSDLVATLEAFLDTGGHVVETARALHIHRSTLYYRLDRIRALTGSDLFDGAIRNDLHAGMRVARLAGLMKSR